jgi:hypothetical protein
MKFVEDKQELSKFCHLPDFNVSHTATHVKTIVNLIPNTGQHLHVIWFTGTSNANFEWM